MLARWLETNLPSHQRVYVRQKRNDMPMALGPLGELHHQVSNGTLPLPSARLSPDEDLPFAVRGWQIALQSVLNEEQIRLEELKLKGMRRPFFSKGERAITCQPAHVSAETGTDERHPGRRRLNLQFELLRGSYATLLVKRITTAH
jgi:tRNA pseudouridine13 synthase